MKQKLLGREIILEAVKESAPAQVICQVLRGNAPESCHPTLEAGVVAVDALDMPDAVSALAVEGRNEVTRFHFQFLRNRPAGGIAICTQHGTRAQQRAQRVGQGQGGARRENLVELDLCAALHCHDHGDLFGPGTVLGFAASLLRGAREVLALAFVGNREEGFVRFHDPRQGRRLLSGQELQELVAPAERLVHRHSKPCRCLADRQSIRHTSRVLQQLFLAPQSVKRGARQRCEGLATVFAAVAL